MSNAIGFSRESNPSRRICHLHAVLLGHVGDGLIFVIMFVFAAINCGEPPVKNALLVTSNFSLHVRITLECLAGYRLVPTPPVPPVVTCEIPGNWVPDPSVYKCQGGVILCGFRSSIQFHLDEWAHSGLDGCLPSQVKPFIVKLLFTAAFLLDAQH